MTADAHVRIPPDLRVKCEKRIEGTNFDSVEEYVQFVMAALLDAEGARSRATAETDEAGADEDVTERLESLGYL